MDSVNQLLGRALLGMQFTPKLLLAATANIGAVQHTVGSGLHDITSSGTYTATLDHTYTIKITATNKFQWKKDSGAFSGDVTITGSAQTLSDGVSVTFGHTTGYTLNDQFTIDGNAGVALGEAQALGNIAVISIGNGATLSIYDGDGTDGDLIYQSVTANWTAGELINLGYGLQNGKGMYIVLSAVTTIPNLVIGYN